jgi:hypothetical protein
MLKSLRGVRLVLKMGKNQPKGVPYDVIMALTRIEVTDNAVERDTFQMSFTAGKKRPRDYGILSTGLFEPYTRVGISLTIGAKVEPLMSGVITHFQLNPSNDAGMSSFTVTGEGIDVMLGLKERNAKYDQQSDTTIVQGLVDKYARYGLNLDVASEAQGLDQPDDNHIIPRQYATDLAHIQQLAARNGYVFYSDPLPNGDVRVYWGPENRKGKRQPPLTMNMGPSTNVTQLNFTQDTRSAFTSQGSRMQVDDDNRSEEDVPPPSRFDVNDLAKTVTSFGDRIVLMRDIAKYTTKRADERASELMKGRFNAVSATGEVDTVRYGHILRAGELVGLRGAGALYNGDYYVSQVVHVIERDKYIQRFTLNREGLGATRNKVR